MPRYHFDDCSLAVSTRHCHYHSPFVFETSKPIFVFFLGVPLLYRICIRRHPVTKVKTFLVFQSANLISADAQPECFWGRGVFLE